MGRLAPPKAGKGGKGGMRAASPARGSSQDKMAKPRSVMCHICGREFGTTSIDIHVPQCAKKWEAVEGQKPAKERRPVPTKPEPVAGMDLEEYNKAAQENFNEQGMMRCENCGRTFLADSLVVHLRSCKPGKSSKPPGEEGGGDRVHLGSSARARSASVPPASPGPRPGTGAGGGGFRGPEPAAGVPESPGSRAVRRGQRIPGEQLRCFMGAVLSGAGQLYGGKDAEVIFWGGE